MNITLKNLMEDIVMKEINSIIGSLGVCTCELCRLDIASYALNRVPPKYTVTVQGELLAKLDILDSQNGANILSAIVKGAEIVKQNPRHE